MTKWQKLKKEWKHKEPRQKAYMILGGVFIAAAGVGIVIPVIPQVPFALAAAFLFSKGSRRVHEWIRQNRFVGQPVRNWEDHHVIRPKLKIISSVFMLALIPLAHWKLTLEQALVVDAGILLTVAFVLTRPNFPTAKTKLH